MYTVPLTGRAAAGAPETGARAPETGPARTAPAAMATAPATKPTIHIAARPQPRIDNDLPSDTMQRYLGGGRSGWVDSGAPLHDGPRILGDHARAASSHASLALR
jgi:hypothetical protein